MTSYLPPLNSLRAFIVASKHKSFTKAAPELGVTQGAVSKQVGILENYLGINLFERRHQNLELTKPAKIYLASINEVFNIIASATEQLTRKDQKNILNISILPSLTGKWLIPMMRHFYPLYHLNIEVGSGYDAVDFNSSDLDIAIRIVKKGQKWNNCGTENIIKEKLLCVCSPYYLKKHPIKKAADLLKCDLLGNSSRPLLWKNYLKFLEIKNSQIKNDVSFEHFFMLIDAAKDDLGIIMAPDFIIEEELATGRLVTAFNAPFLSSYSYQLIYPKQKSHYKKIEDFKKWAKENWGSRKVNNLQNALFEGEKSSKTKYSLKSLKKELDK